MLLDSNKLLAKLLSQEDLRVIQSSRARTASFNTLTRVLTLPKSSTLTEGYILHEVGHALHTPGTYGVEMLHKYGGLINVLEDARIERKIKKRYPGSISKFNHLYKMMEGQISMVVSVMKLVDRLNLFANQYKSDHDYGFTPEEEVFKNRMMKTNTFEDVVQLADDIREYIKKNAPQQPQQKETEQTHNELADHLADHNESEESDDVEEQEKDVPVPSNNEVDDDNVDDDDEVDDNSTEESDDDEESDDGKSGEAADADEDEESDEDSGSTELTDDELTEELKSDTQEEYDEEVQKQIDSTIDYDVGEFYLSKDKNIKNNITKGRQLLSTSIDKNDLILVEEYKRDEVANMKKRVGKIGTHMAATFERDKKADENSRTQVSSSGTLNTRKLHQYKISDDIFNTVEIIREGKSHGVQLLVDFSGSMRDRLLGVLEQSYLLVDFCQKTNIPYEVYGFTSGYNVVDVEEGHIRNDDTQYFLLSSSAQSKQLNTFSFDIAYKYAIASINRSRFSVDFKSLTSIYMGRTPLNQAVYGMSKIISDFKHRNNIQVCSFIVFTDGGDTEGLDTSNGSVRGVWGDGKSADVIDTQTGKTYQIKYGDDTTNLLYNMLQDRHNVNIVSIRMGTQSELASYIKGSYYVSGHSSNPKLDMKNFRGKFMVELTDESTVTNIMMRDDDVGLGKNVDLNTPSNKSLAANFKTQMKASTDSRVFANLVVGKLTENFVK